MKAMWFVFFVGFAIAEPSATASAEESVFRLGEVTVTEQAADIPSVVDSAVSRFEMQRFDRNTVSAAANLLPGVTLSRTGARNESTLYVRGFDIKHVPIYLDGIPIYVPYDGYPDLGRFYTYDLSEIVLSKDFASVLYGPNTMGGAINMVSRRPSAPLEGDVGARFATGNTYNAFANLGIRHEQWYVQAGASGEYSTGFDLPRDFRESGSEDGGRRNNSYHRDWKGSAKVGWTPNNNDEYALSCSYQHGVKGTPPYTGPDPAIVARYWRWPYWDKQSLYFTSKTRLGEQSYIKSRVYYDIFRNSLWAYDDASYTTLNKKSSFKSHYDDYTYGGSLEGGTTVLANNDLRVAIHFKDDVHREANIPNPLQHFEDRIYSVGLEDTLRPFDQLIVKAGISYDALATLRAQDYNAAVGTLSSFGKDDVAA